QVAGRVSFWQYKKRLVAIPTSAPDPVTPEMEPQLLEGYANRHFFHPGQTISFYLKADLPENSLQVQYLHQNTEWVMLATHSFGQILQPDTLEEAQTGCG